VPIRKFERIYGRISNISLHHLAHIQNYFHNFASGFTHEACAVKENRGPCVYVSGFYGVIDGVRKCSIFAVGECDGDIKL